MTTAVNYKVESDAFQRNAKPPPLIFLLEAPNLPVIDSLVTDYELKGGGAHTSVSVQINSLRGPCMARDEPTPWR